MPSPTMAHRLTSEFVGTISGGHFNPAVTLLFGRGDELTDRPVRDVALEH